MIIRNYASGEKFLGFDDGRPMAEAAENLALTLIHYLSTASGANADIHIILVGPNKMCET